VFAGRADAATTTYEAESGTVTAGVVQSNHAGFSGSGFVNTDNAVGSRMQWSTRSVAGSATLRFRFANGTATDRPMRITVNGTEVGAAPAFPGTGAWSTWQEATVTATLRAGSNTVQATAGGGPNLDRLTVVDGGTTPPPAGGTPVAVNGQLRVCGVKLCNQYGRPDPVARHEHPRPAVVSAVREQRLAGRPRRRLGRRPRTAVHVHPGGWLRD
jgi:endoglucanase